MGQVIRGNEIEVSFSHADGGLKSHGDELKGFEIAGQNKQWKRAKAHIDGTRIIVSNAEIESPVAVRYSWAAMPDGNLANGHGLPASPFRLGN